MREQILNFPQDPDRNPDSPRIISLVFVGDSTKRLTPIGDVLGCQYAWIHHNLHIVSMLDKEEWFKDKFKAWGFDVYEEVNRLEIPVIVQKRWKHLKNQIVYPYKEIVKAFGVDYFTCSQAYLLALAIYEGYDEIHLIGWDNNVPSTLDVEWNNVVWDEYACMNFWVGFAKGRGINVIGGHVAKVLTRGNNARYAYDVSRIHERKRKEILEDLNMRKNNG